MAQVFQLQVALPFDGPQVAGLQTGSDNFTTNFRPQVNRAGRMAGQILADLGPLHGGTIAAVPFPIQGQISAVVGISGGHRATSRGS
ncbi:MAG: hypothetical protein ACO3JG_11185 [Luteolibacter sp.]